MCNLVLGYLGSVEHKILKRKENFWQHKLETFYPLGVNEKLVLILLIINLSFFLYIYIFLIYFSFYLFIYLFIFYLPLCMCVHCKPACVSICKHVFLLPCLNICQLLFLCVCLFDCYPAPVIIFALYL